MGEVEVSEVERGAASALSVKGKPKVWSRQEALERAKKFVHDSIAMKAELLEHFEHKAHKAMKFTDDMAGFVMYCAEYLQLDITPATIKLQLETAKVSKVIEADIPTRIARHLAKLTPDQQKKVYTEIMSREGAGQRTVDQMEPDVRKVVNSILRPPPPIVVGEVSAPRKKADMTPIVPPTYDKGPEHDEDPFEAEDEEDDEFEEEEEEEPTILSAHQARSLIGFVKAFKRAYEAKDVDQMAALYKSVAAFIRANEDL